VQRNLTPGGDKNGADINLALDALEMVFTHQHINAYVIVGGDSDFLSLVEKLKQYDKKVFVCGGRAFTSMILQRNCHEFIAYENLTRSRRPAVKGDKPVTVTAASPIAQAFAIVRRALKILSDREVSPQTGLLKSTLLQLDSTFSERNYGASSFLDFAEKLAQAGLVTLKHSGRSVMVELNDGFDEAAGQTAPKTGAATDGGESASPAADGAGGGQIFRPGAGDGAVAQVFRPAGDQPPSVEPPPQAGDQAEGVRLVGQILRNASNARWPMYLRNVKQILRATDGGFDERRYGFGGLMDLLRACQRDGLVRVERDRRGGLRVFPSQGLQRAEASPVAQVPDLLDADAQPTEIEPGNRLEVDESLDAEQPDSEVVPIDTTAELLGRAGAKPRRTRVAVAARGTRKAAARKPAARRPRAKKEAE
jgi:hypothetical protein